MIIDFGVGSWSLFGYEIRVKVTSKSRVKALCDTGINGYGTYRWILAKFWNLNFQPIESDSEKWYVDETFTEQVQSEKKEI